MYTTFDFKTKKALRLAIKNGDDVELYQPGPFGGGTISDGTHSVEGPHFPLPHKWYARVIVKKGKVVSVS